MLRFRSKRWALPAILALALAGTAPAADRLRLLIETDAGGDPDDEQSLVRFLLAVCALGHAHPEITRSR